jgi:tripartite-type tricarboxylate transporter receptor subunit TctC
MKFARRHFLNLAAGAAALPTLSGKTLALDYPTRPVRIIVGFAAGGPTDIFARLIAQWLSQRLGQSFIVENRPGAGSTIGIGAVVAAPPDGYTLLLVSTSAVISANYYPHLTFDVIRDIAPVCGIADEPMLLAVNPSFPAKTVSEFIAYAKAHPGKVSMAASGNGTTAHLAGELFKQMTGVELLHIPYRGGAPALTDVMGGRADAIFEGLPSLMGYVQAGKLRPLAVSTAARSPALPDIPTVAETVPGYQASVWFGVGVPKDTPSAIVELLNKEINAGLSDPALKAHLLEVGGTPLAGSPAAFAKLFVEDTEKWAKVIKAANIKAE